MHGHAAHVHGVRPSAPLSSDSSGPHRELHGSLGKTWGTPMPLKPALGADDGVLVGPGRGLQLSSTAHGKAGRLLFCGHKADTFSGRLSPIVSAAAPFASSFEASKKRLHSGCRTITARRTSSKRPCHAERRRRSTSTVRTSVRWRSWPTVPFCTTHGTTGGRLAVRRQLTDSRQRRPSESPFCRTSRLKGSPHVPSEWLLTRVSGLQRRRHVGAGVV